MAADSAPQSTMQLHQGLSHLLYDDLDPAHRVEWIRWLRPLLIEEIGSTQGFSGYTDKLLDASIRLCDWSSEILIREQLLATCTKTRSHPMSGNHGIRIDVDIEENIKALIHLYLAKGEYFPAFLLFQKYALTTVQDTLPNALYDLLQEYDQTTPYLDEDLQYGDICLTPLHYRHKEAFCWLYASPSISELCNLPVFYSDAQWYDWLEQGAISKEQQVFAVIHRNWGMVGSVALTFREGLSSFYYWIGEEFQRCGFGPAAVEILMDLAEKYYAVNRCFAKVYGANFPSQKALCKLGFTPLPFIIRGENGPEKIYYRGPETSAWTLFEQAQIVFPPLCEQHFAIADLSGFLEEKI